MKANIPASRVERKSVMTEGTLRAISIPVITGTASNQGSNVEFGVQCCRKFRDLLCIVRFVCESHYCKDDKGDEERGDGGDHHIADMAE